MTGMRLHNRMVEAFMESDNELLLRRGLELQSTKPNYRVCSNRNVNFVTKLNTDIQSFSSSFFHETINTFSARPLREMT